MLTTDGAGGWLCGHVQDLVWLVAHFYVLPKMSACSLPSVSLPGRELGAFCQSVSEEPGFRTLTSAKTNHVIPGPVYCSEIAPPGLRGLFVGMCGVFVGLGYALGTYMGLAFYTATNDAQWRGQYGVTIFINLVMIVAVYFTPESPRWLLMMDRPHAAKEVVQNLYNLTETDEHNAAIAELYQMQRQTEYDRSLDPSWLQMFRRPSYRKRVILTCGYAFVGQSTACMGKRYDH
jgi:hypothetical protein